MLCYYLVHKKGTTIAYLADSAYSYLFFKFRTFSGGGRIKLSVITQNGSRER